MQELLILYLDFGIIVSPNSYTWTKTDNNPTRRRSAGKVDEAKSHMCKCFDHVPGRVRYMTNGL